MSGLVGKTRTDDAPPRQPSRWSELGPRTGSALVMATAALGTAIGGGLVFDVFWLAASLGILWEWLRLVGGPRTSQHFVLGALALMSCAALTAAGLPLRAALLLAGVGVVLAVSAQAGSRLITGLGLLYAGSLVIAVALLRHSAPFGREAILFLFAVVWGTDCMAYFGGRLIGGPKLAPRLSPSKTWSGFLIGIVSGSLLGWVMSPAPASLGPMVILGLVTGAVAQGGDIFESVVKRRFKVKDAGRLIPGHGGLMDRLDGFVAASLFAACLGLWRAGTDAAGAGLFQW